MPGKYDDQAVYSFKLQTHASAVQRNLLSPTCPVENGKSHLCMFQSLGTTRVIGEEALAMGLDMVMLSSVPFSTFSRFTVSAGVSLQSHMTLLC